VIDRFDTESAVSMTFATVDDILISAAHRQGARHEVVVVCDGTGPTDVALGENGIPRAGRRMLAGSSTEDVLAWMREQGAMRAEVAIYGHAARAKELAEACRNVGANPRIVSVRVAGAETVRGLLAALAVTAVPALPLHRTSDRVRANQRSTSTTRWIALAAAASLVIGLLLEQAVTSRQLRQVKERRATIAVKVAKALSARDSLQHQTDVVSALADREAHASRDGGVLAAIALALPRGASLTSLQVNGDSVSLEGESRDGAAVYDALRSLTALEHVTLAAPLRQERGVAAGDVSVGHFAFSARLREGSR
jgi:Tfp pilus assembly protein PilN